jgi:hypothetical protein
MGRLASDGLRRSALVLALLASGASGCLLGTGEYKHYRARADFEKTARAARTVGLVTPVVRVFEYTAGGQTVLKDEWSTQGRKAIGDALRRALAEKGWKVKLVEPAGPTKDDLEEARLLYGDVGPSITRATYGNYGYAAFPEKVRNFDYSVGPLNRVMDQAGVDLLVLAYGYDEVSSSGRAVVNTLNAILGTGSTGGDSFLNVALIDRNGKVLWFDVEMARGAYDLRDPASADSFVRVILDRLELRKS